jgi:hypothetical protein
MQGFYYINTTGFVLLLLECRLLRLVQIPLLLETGEQDIQYSDWLRVPLHRFSLVRERRLYIRELVKEIGERLVATTLAAKMYIGKR